MKKLKLLFAACALLLGVSNASAQTDVTSTYITNADFSTGTPIDNNVCTYGKDMAGNNTTYYSAQSIDGWTNASVGDTDSGYENSKLAGALFEYGSTPWLAGSGNVAPATDPNGTAGNAAGLCAVWGGSIQYTQDVTLPAGSYTVVFKVYNTTTGSGNSSGVITKDLFGFKADAGTEYYAPNNTFAIGQWSTIAVTFNLSEETAGKISMGYVGPSGNAAMPHLFVDNVKIYANEVYEDCTSKVNTTGWTGATDGYQGGTINTARQYGDKSIGRHIYQTVSGLENGSYEVAIYSISQKEWNGSLANDAGDVAYVVAEGAYELKEMINARARAAYPGDENLGIYTISGVKVTDGTLTLGMGLDKANLTEWHHVQIKSLIRTNAPDLSDFIEAYNNALAAAQAVDQSAKMAASIKSALQGALNTYADDKVDKTSQEALETATAALNTATANANTSIAQYASLLTAITDANNHTVYTPVFSASTEIYNAAVSAAQGVYDAAEVDDCTAAINALTDGIHSAYEKDYTTFSEDYDYDYSTLLSQDLTKWATSDYVVMTANEHWNGQTGQRYYEQSSAEWGQNSWSHEAYETPSLPAGKYVMSITARASADVTSTMSVKVGDNDAVIVALPNKGATGRGITTDGIGSFADGTYANTNGRGWEYRFIAFTVEEESPVTIKFNSSTNAVNNWVSIASPLLKGDVHPNQIKLNQAKSLVATLSEYKENIPAAAYATFADDITAANNATVESTNLDEIITALQNDIATAATAVSPYAEFKALWNKAYNLKNVGNDNSKANDDLDKAIGDLDIAAANATTTSAIEAATADLKAAMTTYVSEANPVGDGAKFDCTFLMTNPDLSSFAAWTSVDDVDGWYSDMADGNKNTQKSDGVACTKGNAFFEYWSGTAKANNEFALYNKVENLPEGTYTINCYALATANGVAGATTSAIYFYANDTKGSIVSADVLTPASISFVNDEQQDVKIGLKAMAGNQFRWMGIGYVELYKVPAKTYTIDEDADWDYTQSGAGDVTLTRNIKKGFNTLVLPFSMTQTEVEDAFGEGSVVYELKSFDGEVIRFDYEGVDGVTANKPCILKATEAGSSYEIKGRTLVAGDANPTATVDPVSLIGSYAASFPIPYGESITNYVVSGDKLYLVDSDVTIKGTRAYFNVVADNPARTISLSFDGEVTGIATVEGGEVKKVVTGDIYDLQGRKVKNPSKGIYVVEGKKVVF